MISSDGENLIIFDNFVIDYNLPKHKKENSSDDKIEFDSLQGNISWNQSNSTILTAPNISVSSTTKKQFLKKLLSKIKFHKKSKLISIEKFFENIKNNLSTFEDEDIFDRYDERKNNYIKTIQYAIECGQISLAETLKQQLNIVQNENLLYASDKKEEIRIILEEQMVKFIKDSEKGIRIDWIKNFNRIIPEKIVQRKKEFDKLKVFDNYVVVHYDPNKKSYKETEAEKRKRKDPILFGVIKNINKLYYIGDWKDEYCDLTLNDLINKFGEEVIKNNNITVNFR